MFSTCLVGFCLSLVGMMSPHFLLLLLLCSPVFLVSLPNQSSIVHPSFFPLRWFTTEILEALSAEQTEALAANLNERCKNLQFDEGLTKGAAVFVPKEIDRSTTLRLVQASRMSDNIEKTGGLFLIHDGKD